VAVDLAAAGLLFSPCRPDWHPGTARMLYLRAIDGNTMGSLKLRRRRTALAAGLATLAMAVSLAAVPAQAAEKTKYIALGDSYAAGQGAGPYKNDTCYRSENSYSELAADSKAIKLVTNAACSGKTTQEVVATQLRQLNKSTDLVTITAGGNNLGFGDIVTTCGTAIFDSAFAAACADASATAKAKLVSGQLAGDVASMIQSVQAAAPNARIVVTGYPYLFDPIPAGRTDRMSQFIYRATDLADGLNGSIAVAAAATDPTALRVKYVDVRTAFAGHGIISNDPWINGAVPDSPDGFHPNAKGYKAYYTALSSDGTYSAP
jgi:lysophospholipase L1-like esterase